MALSRRSLLKRGALATASIPFLSVQSAVEAWHALEEPVPVINGDMPVVRLSHNENPYGPSEKARQAIIDAIGAGNRYPRNAISELQEAIAAKEQVSADQILISAGSTELLGLFGLYAGINKGRVISCTPTFDFMCRYAEQFAVEWVKVPLTSDHQYNLKGINDNMDDMTRLVFVCNPNNPTGAELSSSMLHPFCQTLSERCMVYVDEAYIELSKEGTSATMASMTRAYPNLVVGRTFSKVYGLAGMRVGYAIGHPETIGKVRKYMQGNTVTPSVCSVAAAMASLNDDVFVEEYKKTNSQGQNMVYEKFDKWGIEYINSSTNFIFFKTDRFENPDIRSSLAESNVMIRDYSHTPGWARVSIGTPDEMKTFLDTTKKYLS